MLVSFACAERDGDIAPEQPNGSAYWRGPDGGRLTVDVVGHEFAWHFRYPGPDGQPGTVDDVETTGDLHLPSQTDAELRLHSRDFIYTFALPELGQHEVAVPEMTFTVSFATEAPRTLELLGDQMCGFQHEQLKGKLVIESDREFLGWLGEQERPR